MKPHLFLCLAVLVAANARAAAQTTTAPDPRPALPPGPILSVAPEFSAWTVVRQTLPGLRGQSAEAVVRNAASSVPPDSLLAVTKTGQVRHHVRKLKTGQQEDIWYEHGNRITMENGWKIPMFEAATAPANQPLGPDFPELGWITATNFVGVQRYQDNDYLVFESEVADAGGTADGNRDHKQTTTLHRAYVNADTRLPWLVQTGEVLCRYVFQEPPTSPLEVPAAFQTMFDTFEQRKAHPARKPIAP